MANPNLNSVTSVICQNSLVPLDSTNATLIVSNADSSGAVFLLESLIASNVDGTNSGTLTLVHYDTSDNSGNATKLANTVAIPADSTLMVLTKDSGVNVLENQSIYATASAAGDLHIAAYWKELS